MYGPFVFKRNTVVPVQQRNDAHLCLKIVACHVAALKKHIHNVIVSNAKREYTQVVNAQYVNNFCSMHKCLDQSGPHSHARASFNTDPIRFASRRRVAVLSDLKRSSAWRMKQQLDRVFICGVSTGWKCPCRQLCALIHKKVIRQSLAQ